MSSYAKARAHVLSLLPRETAGAEIGVWKGDFSAEILNRAAPRQLHLIDPWALREDPSHASAWYSATRGVDIEAIHAGVRARFDGDARVSIHRGTSSEIMPGLSELGFVYIDGDHAFEGVQTDLGLAFGAVRTGGLICLDDHRQGKWWGDGVIRAANAFLGQHAARLEIVFCYGDQLVLRKREP